VNWYKKAESQFYNDLIALSDIFAQKAQAVYDVWKQDKDGMDEELGAGGICHLVADDIADVIHSSIPYATAAYPTSCSWEQHVYVITYIDNPPEGYIVDVPYHQYETGGAFTWKKIPDVVFDGSYVSIQRMDDDNLQYEISEEEF